MSNVLKKLAIAFILLGTIGVGIMSFFGASTITYITRERIEGDLWMYKYDLPQYLSDLSISFQDPTLLELEIPDYVGWNNSGTIEAIAHNLKLIPNTIILFGNILIYPIRVGAYILRQALQILGINTLNPNQNSGLYWLINLINTLQTLQIPLIA